jgi:hypothetical protein
MVTDVRFFVIGKTYVLVGVARLGIESDNEIAAEVVLKVRRMTYEKGMQIIFGVVSGMTIVEGRGHLGVAKIY